MTKVNEVLKMLDWNNPQKIQNKEIKLASEIHDLNMLIQPNDELYNKSIWDNCAIILRDKTDDEIQPYLNQLLEWLQDLNWPGAMIIKERLANYKNTKELISAINVCTDHAVAANDFIWLDNLNSILKNNSNDGKTNLIYHQSIEAEGNTAVEAAKAVKSDKQGVTIRRNITKVRAVAIDDNKELLNKTET